MLHALHNVTTFLQECSLRSACRRSSPYYTCKTQRTSACKMVNVGILIQESIILSGLNGKKKTPNKTHIAFEGAQYAIPFVFFFFFKSPSAAGEQTLTCVVCNGGRVWNRTGQSGEVSCFLVMQSRIRSCLEKEIDILPVYTLILTSDCRARNTLKACSHRFNLSQDVCSACLGELSLCVLIEFKLSWISEM